MAKKQQTSIYDMLGRPSQAQLDTRILVSCLGATKLLMTKVQSMCVVLYNLYRPVFENNIIATRLAVYFTSPVT